MRESTSLDSAMAADGSFVSETANLDASTAAVVGLRPIAVTGDSANRVDIVFLGDGYTTSEIETTYTSHVLDYLSYIFDDSALTQPFGRYENFFNIHAIDVVSNESGADNPGTGTVRDTALDASYYWDGVTARLLYVSNAKASAAVADALGGTTFGAEMTYVLVNDTTYGGGGGVFAVYAAGNSSAREVALHEVGHSFARLADEYGGIPEMYPGSELAAINVTTNPAGEKWAEWLGYIDPVLGAVGAYEGGSYYDFGIFRPTFDSKMRSLGQPFDPIAQEAFVIGFYGYVDPLDSHDDNAGTRHDVQSLSVDVIDPAVIRVDWTVNGQTFVDVGETFSFGAYGLGPGEYTVTARAYDPTDWVRGDRSQLEQTVTWTVDNLGQNAVITGTDGDDILEGTPGDDVIVALAGDDRIAAGAGNDIAHGDAGGDQILGEDGDDTLTGGDGWDFINGGNGHDHISGGGTNDELWGLPGDDTISGGAGPDRLFGNEGSDLLLGEDGDDLLEGGEDDDSLFGGRGSDVLNGGPGVDNAFFDGTADAFSLSRLSENQWIVTEIATGDTDVVTDVEVFRFDLLSVAVDNIIIGTEGNDILDGTAADEMILALAGDDRVSGGDGDDALFGGAGGDHLSGGAGNDQASGGDGGDQILGDDGDDSLSGGEGWDFINGGLGNDRIDGGATNDELWGLPGDDTIFGSEGPDRLFGNEGADNLSGDQQHAESLIVSDDLLVGGEDADLLVGDASATLFHFPYQQNLSPPEGGGVPIPVGLGLSGVGANDTLEGGTGDDILIGDAGFIHAGRGGNDLLLGGDGDDRMYGDAYTGFVTVGGVGPGPPAPPTILSPGAGIGGSASGGDDHLEGGEGNDTMVGDAFDFQTPFQGSGSGLSGGVDTLMGGNGDDILAGDAMSMVRSTAMGGDDRLFGGDGNDTLAGDALRDDNGRGGNDRLFGEAGDDTLRGGSGNDILDGGEGMDTALFDGNIADFQIGGSVVTHLATGEADLLSGIEVIRFSDTDFLLV